MSRSIYDVVIVGAGPAGIAAAIECARSGAGKIALIDCGRPIRQRHCPADHAQVCRGCGGTCNVISGFGGSVHYGDGVKLSKFPSGRRLHQVLGHKTGDELMKDAIDILFDGGKVPEFARPPEKILGLDVKSYPIVEFGGVEVSKLLSSLLNRINSYDSIELLLKTVAVTIKEEQDFISVSLEGTSGHTDVLRARNVIVATGRRGHRWWRSELRRLGIEHSPPCFSVGMRFLCPPGYLRPAGTLHPDFKTSMEINGIKIKTFCFCAGAGGGRLKFADHGEYVLLDGHVLTDGQSTVENVALLAQLRGRDLTPDSFDGIYDEIISKYRMMRPDSPGRPVIQWYPDFAGKVLSMGALQEVLEASGFSMSTMDFGVGDLSKLLSSGIHSAFCIGFERLLSAFHGGCDVREMVRHVAVAGLELEGIWDEVTTDDAGQTSLRGLYVAGDCAGKAQGILQAATSGLASARSCISNLRSQ